MNNPQIERIAISYDEGEDGCPPGYTAHVFMAPPDHRVIKLDPCNSLEEAQQSAEDFLKLLEKIQQSMQQEGDYS